MSVSAFMVCKSSNLKLSPSAVNMKLPQKLMDLNLRDGVKIISLKEVSSLRGKLNAQKLHLRAILDVNIHEYPKATKETQYVSWTGSSEK